MPHVVISDCADTHVNCTYYQTTTLREHVYAIANDFFSAAKNDNFQLKNCDMFLYLFIYFIFYFLLKTYNIVGTHNLCFRVEIRKIM